MANTDLLQSSYALGIRRDGSRDQLPRDAVWDMVDWIPELGGAALRKRGGWKFSTSDLNAISSASRADAVGWAPFTADGHLIAISESGKLFRSVNLDDASGEYISTPLDSAPTAPPFFWRDRMVLLHPSGSVDPVKYYKSGTYQTASFGGTPPRAKVGAAHGEYILLANGGDPASAYAQRANRIWWSPVGNPDGFWNTSVAGAWTDMLDDVVSIVPLRSVVLVFSWSSVWQMRYTIPPPTNTDLDVDNLFSMGTMDGRSVDTYGEYVIFANNSGVWRTDGAVLTDLTEAGGISQLWHHTVSGFSFANGWSAAGGVYRGEYWITVTSPAGVNTTLVCDLDRVTWRRVSNVETLMYATRTSGQGSTSAPLVSGNEEMFFGWREGARAGKLSSIWTPGESGLHLDGDGQAVLPVLETGFYAMGTTSSKRLRRAYANYDLRAAAGIDTTLLVEGVLDPSDTAYVQYEPTLPATTKQTKDFVYVNDKAYGIALRIRPSAAASDLRLGALELEGHALEGSR
jgi:hypothetical protein